MAKNIIIFSDGTGQRGGILFDESRSNIYKLYRATRCGPDSIIDPAEQLTYYDPGIGTEPTGLGFFERKWRKLHNFVSQATGLGITANIIDCYAQIIRLWQPGDRIFLFGFSRGSYTIRCLASVLAFCGVPTVGKDGGPIKRDLVSARAVAKIGVKKVYQHVSSPNDEDYVEQRQLLAQWFRKKFGSGDDAGPNAHPYFIGALDTVAAIATPAAVLLVVVIGLGLIFGASVCLWVIFGWFWRCFMILCAGSAVIAAILLTVTNLRFAFGLPGVPWWKTVHLTNLRMRFYDNQLNPHVGYARHAISIDETRPAFSRVPWGCPREWRDTGEGNPVWFKQFWFAGNHADIGGGYPENETRLSDTALQWMVEEVQSLPNTITIDPNVLHLSPDPLGMQHDEWLTGGYNAGKPTPRTAPPNATLHESVLKRFEAQEVLHYNAFGLYRPEALRHHESLGKYYETSTGPAAQKKDEC